MEIQIQSEAKKPPQPRNVSVQRAPVTPQVDAETAISMALADALPTPVAGVSTNDLTLIDSQTLAQESINFMAESLSWLLVEATMSGYEPETYHRIMASSQHLATLARMLRLDDTQVQVLIQKIAEGWSEYSELLEAQEFNVADETLEHEEDDGEYDDEEEVETEEGAAELLSLDDEEDDESDPTIAPINIGVSPDFLDTPDSMVCRDVDAMCFNGEVGDLAANSLMAFVKDRIDNSNFADLVVFAPSFTSYAFGVFANPAVQGRVRIKPVTLDVQNIDGWAEAQLMIRTSQTAGAWPSYDADESGMPTMRRVPRIELGRALEEEEQDTEVERDDE